EVRSFCIKDHRNWPKSEDCGPGFGEIDHYKLLHPVAFTGLTMSLSCENIFAPLVPRPDKPEGVDALAKRAREFLEVVIAGLHTRKWASRRVYPHGGLTAGINPAARVPVPIDAVRLLFL